jgi:type IV pilus assembly protein PilA
MSPLNSRLQLALLNRKQGRNLLEKGFTLVELMIVIVIVGILSAVALPNFLSQTSKAKATECKSQLAAQLKQIAAEYVSSGIPLEAVSTVVDLNAGGTAVTPSTAAATVADPDAISLSSNAGIFSYVTKTPGSSDKAIIISCQAWTPTGGVNPINATNYPDAKADAGLKGGGLFGCVNLDNGQIKISKSLQPTKTVVTADTELSDGTKVCGAGATEFASTTLL